MTKKWGYKILLIPNFDINIDFQKSSEKAIVLQVLIKI